MNAEPEMWTDVGKYSRRDEVVMNRMRLGHTLLTHGYLVDNDAPEVAPYCELCSNALLSVKYMVECQKLMNARLTSLEMWKHNIMPIMRELLEKNLRINEISFFRSIGRHSNKSAGALLLPPPLLLLCLLRSIGAYDFISVVFEL